MIELVALVGPTAAGKTSLGVELAGRLGGEVVSADAFAVYRGLDIGTAKPGAAERAAVPHHLVDVADPVDTYSAGMFVRDADAAIAAIRGRGRVPIVVGGTLFYLQSLLRGLFPEPERLAGLREHLRSAWAADPETLRRWLGLLDPGAAARIAAADQQRVVRALEVALTAGRPMTELWRREPQRPPRYRALVIGVALQREVLRARIAARVARMFAAGLLAEVRGLLDSGVPAGAHAMKAIGYRECCEVLAGRIDVDQARARAVTATGQLAKRQMTWLRGEADAVWLHGDESGWLRQAIAEVEARGGPGAGAA